MKPSEMYREAAEWLDLTSGLSPCFEIQAACRKNGLDYVPHLNEFMFMFDRYGNRKENVLALLFMSAIYENKGE